MLHCAAFHQARVYTVCKGNKDPQTKESNYSFENYNLLPLDYTMGYLSQDN